MVLVDNFLKKFLKTENTGQKICELLYICIYFFFHQAISTATIHTLARLHPKKSTSPRKHFRYFHYLHRVQTLITHTRDTESLIYLTSRGRFINTHI